MASPYQLLDDYLAVVSPETPAVTLTFGELRAILGQPLPASAWGRSWWRTRRWPTRGWRVATVCLSSGREAVTFARIPLL